MERTRPIIGVGFLSEDELARLRVEHIARKWASVLARAEVTPSPWPFTANDFHAAPNHAPKGAR